MEIVIKISDERFRDIQRIAEVQTERKHFKTAEQIIANGTPLPKGHGKLGDLGALSDYFWDNRSKLYTHKDLQIVLDNAPTIIEADTESGGEE